MHFYSRAGITLAALAGCVLMLRPASAQLINGSFENTGGTFVNNGSGYMTVNAGLTTIPGWTVTNAQIAWLTAPNSAGIALDDGNFFLDLTGDHDNGVFGGMTQTVNTIPGSSYTLGLDLGTQESNSQFRGPVSVNVQTGATSQGFTFTPSVGSTGTQWKNFTLNFLASGTTTPITITGTGAAGGAYLGLDHVTLSASTPATPEPGMLALLAGLGISGLAMRRRARH